MLTVHVINNPNRIINEYRTKNTGNPKKLEFNIENFHTKGIYSDYLRFDI